MSLWKMIGGEPWMVNPRLGLLTALMNPQHKRKTKGVSIMAKTAAQRRMDWVRSFKKKGKTHRRKSNPFPLGGVALNPHHKKRSPSRSTKTVTVYRKKNPPATTRLMGFTMPPVESVILAGVGFAAPPLIESFLAPMLPLAISTSTIGKYAVRIGSVLGLSWLAKEFVGRREATIVGIAGGAYVLLSAVRDFAPGLIPGMSAYSAVGLGEYTALRALPARRQLRGFGARNSPFVTGGIETVATRFRRLQ